MQDFIHNGREFRIYAKSEYMPIRRQLAADGFRVYTQNDLSGTQISRALLASYDTIGQDETVLVAK